MDISSISNDFVRKYFEDKNLELIDMDEEKVWGGYYIYEVGDMYDKKVLWVKPGHILSVQFHGSQEHPGHSEVWTGLTRFKTILGKESSIGKSDEELRQQVLDAEIVEVGKGDSLEFDAGYIHALANPYDEDIYVLEIRTSQIEEGYKDREANITRIHDQRERYDLTKIPQAVYSKLFAK